jgi:hypothetical protein
MYRSTGSCSSIQFERGVVTFFLLQWGSKASSPAPVLPKTDISLPESGSCRLTRFMLCFITRLLAKLLMCPQCQHSSSVDRMTSQRYCDWTCWSKSLYLNWLAFGHTWLTASATQLLQIYEGGARMNLKFETRLSFSSKALMRKVDQKCKIRRSFCLGNWSFTSNI